MSWEELLQDEAKFLSLPWFGLPMVHIDNRSWTIRGPTPPEHGWWVFKTGNGRWCELVSPGEPDPNYGDHQPRFQGYIVGDRFIQDNTRVDPDPDKLIKQTSKVHCVEPGLERMARATVVEDRNLQLVYLRQEFPLGPEEEVRRAFQDRLGDVSGIAGVTPALELAFRFLTWQRELREERRRQLEQLRKEEEERRAKEERLQQAMRNAGTAIGRRVLAEQDFEAAAKEALRVSGAELLDCRDSYRKGEMVVQYRFRHRRLECVVEKRTLRIVDAGVCLDDHHGTKGDTFFTLESLPGVIGEAMDGDKLVVWRHVDGDEW